MILFCYPFSLFDDAKVRRFFVSCKEKTKLFAQTARFLTHVNKKRVSLICINF